MVFKRSTLSDRQEAAVQKTLQNLRTQRRNRFRILACIDGSEESLVTVRFAARYSVQDNCDLIVLFVRPIDSGLQSGGLQVRLARENMLEAGFEIPHEAGMHRRCLPRPAAVIRRELRKV
jgi:K+-sensing histidine kinase KdpD